MEVTWKETQDTVFCYDNKEDKCNNRKCSKIVTFILAVAFAFVIGLIIGAAISAAILGAIAAVIVLAVILGLLLVLSIILLFCNRRKKDRKCKCCY